MAAAAAGAPAAGVPTPPVTGSQHLVRVPAGAAAGAVLTVVCGLLPV